MPSPRQLPRRAFLRSALATLTLPALESIRPAMANAVVRVSSKTVPNAKRTVCIGNSFGMYQPYFFPEKAGRDYAITPLLKPIERHRKDFSVFSNLDHGIKGGHFSVHSFLSGVRSIDAGSMPDGNISLDQRMAEMLGAETRFPSLTVGSPDGLHGGCMMSWTRTGVRVPPIAGPRQLFEKLFVNGPASGKQKQADAIALRGSILDSMLGDANQLSSRLSGRDREKLDEYFSSIRDVERRLAQQEKWHSIPKPEAPIPKPENVGLIEDIPLLYDLIALALEMDMTRVASLELAGANFQTRALGVQQGYHALSHHGKDPGNIENLVKLELYQTECFSVFLDRLKSATSPDGATLLDQTAVLFGSGMGNGNAHTNSNLPILLAGGGYQLGEHHVLPEAKNQRVPLSNLYLSLLQRMGVEDEYFAKSTGTLSVLS